MTNKELSVFESMSPRLALLLGALTVGVLDIMDAFIFFGVRGVPPVRILQAIASGVLGREAAVAGGVGTAALGLLLHFVIAFLIVSVFFMVSQKLPILTRYPLVTGALYGVVVYLVMTLVIVPASAIHAAPTLPSKLPVLLNGLLIHALGVGIPSALFARAAWSRPPAAA